MNVLLIGSGGREQALAWKILQSPRLNKLYVTIAPERLGLLLADKKAIQSIAIAETDVIALVKFACENMIDLVIIGPEQPLAAGLSDALRKNGVAVFGPSQAAAEIETSKAFAKQFMARHHIPTARFAICNDLSTAVAHLDEINYPIVIKASGLAAGKGVFLPQTISEAKEIARQLLVGHTLGSAGSEIVIEERLEGEEVSLLAFSDGRTLQVMPPVRDHKRLLDDNQGPNTGGMGAYSPVAGCDAQWAAGIATTILQPVINALHTEDRTFVGVLYAGLIVTTSGAQVIEFNARFGDPETQVLMRLLDSDLLTICEACAQQRLAEIKINWKNHSAACVVLAAKGYPEKPEIDQPIAGLNNPPAEISRSGAQRK
jgi:phosphoribosylamine--glycine ligase